MKRRIWKVSFNISGHYTNDFELEMKFPDSAEFSASQIKGDKRGTRWR